MKKMVEWWMSTGWINLLKVPIYHYLTNIPPTSGHDNDLVELNL